MREPVTVANSSCLIALDSIDQLELLRQLYQIVTIPEAVVHECGTPLPAWFRIEAVQNKSLVKTLRLGRVVEEGNPGSHRMALLTASLAFRTAPRLPKDSRRKSGW
jgi:predicted nucleic acid-binding protein